MVIISWVNVMVKPSEVENNFILSIVVNGGASVLSRALGPLTKKIMSKTTF